MWNLLTVPCGPLLFFEVPVSVPFPLPLLCYTMMMSGVESGNVCLQFIKRLALQELGISSLFCKALENEIHSYGKAAF